MLIWVQIMQNLRSFWLCTRAVEEAEKLALLITKEFPNHVFAWHLANKIECLKRYLQIKES